MKERLSLRPAIPAAIVDESTSEQERFQNATLRPIIKLQNDLLSYTFIFLVANKDPQFLKKEVSVQEKIISNAFQSYSLLKQTVIGLILGQFTTEEYRLYSLAANDYNKRISTMCHQRVLSNREQIIELMNDLDGKR